MRRKRSPFTQSCARTGFCGVRSMLMVFRTRSTSSRAMGHCSGDETGLSSVFRFLSIRSVALLFVFQRGQNYAILL